VCFSLGHKQASLSRFIDGFDDDAQKKKQKKRKENKRQMQAKQTCEK